MATNSTTFTPYSTVAPLFPELPSWIPNDLDKQRIQAYLTYEQLYWGVPNSLKLMFRGQEDRPIYLPTPRLIVNTMDRYVAPDFGWVMRTSDRTSTIPETDPKWIGWNDLLRRERFKSSFSGNKLYGIMRGDSVWHITADPTKPEGRRITIRSVDPASYFPIVADDDVDRVVGCHLVEVIKNAKGDTKIKRQTYRKTDTGGVTVETGIFKLDKWGGPDDKPEQVVIPLTALPPTITALPVYHVKNFEEPGNPFGSSELRGYESVLAAIDQSATDEDLALALEGIGLYWTSAASPKDESGQDMPWNLGPGSVLSLQPGDEFGRVGGVGSVSPYQDHIKMLVNAVKETSTASDAATGRVDVSVAESGISLMMQLAPIIASSTRKDDLLLSVMDQMFFDMRIWMSAFEGIDLSTVQIEPTVGDKIPINRTQRLQELNDMLTSGVIDTEYYRTEASKLGYTFPEGLGARVLVEKAAMAEAVLGDNSTQNAPQAGV